MIHKWKDIKNRLPAVRRRRIDRAVQRELEAEGYPKMQEFLDTFGVEITLKLFAAALQYKIKTGKPYLMGAFAFEALKGIASEVRDSFKFY